MSKQASRRGWQPCPHAPLPRQALLLNGQYSMQCHGVHLRSISGRHNSARRVHGNTGPPAAASSPRQAMRAETERTGA